MASTPKFLVYIGATDELSDKLGSIGAKLTGLIDRVTGAGEKISDLGDRMSNWGIKIGLTTALLSEGANAIHEWSDAISEPAFAMEQSISTMSAMTGLGADQLAKIHDRAINFSNTHPGVTADQWASSFTRMQEVFHDVGKAMDAAGVAEKLIRLGVDSGAAEGLISSVFANLGTDAKTTADQFTAMTQTFSLKPEQTQQFGMVLGRLAGIAKETHTPLAALMAIAGQTGQMIPGGRGAQIFASMIQDLGANAQKSGIDISHGILPALHQVKSEIAGMSGTEQIVRLKELGFGGEASMIIPLLDNLDKVDAGQLKIANSAGTFGKAYSVATNDAADNLSKLHNNINNLYDALMAPALPTISTWLTRFTGLVQGASTAAEHHSAISRDLALSLTAVGAGAYYGLQGLSAIGTSVFFVGQAVQMIGKFADVESLALRGMYAWDKIGSIGSSIYSFGSSLLASIPAITTFGAALLANPLTWYVAGAVALGFAAYEIYEHWGQLGGWFSSMWDEVKSIFSAVGNWLGGWGSGVGQAVLFGLTGPFGLIGYQIWKHWDSIKAACEKIAGGIEGYFVGHSPPPVGPLRNLGRVTIAETIAARIRPAPILSAVYSTAAAVALAAPMMAGGGAMAGVGAASGAGAPIIHYAPVINGSGLSEQQLLSVLEKHAYELVQMVNHERERKERTRLS